MRPASLLGGKITKKLKSCSVHILRCCFRGEVDQKLTEVRMNVHPISECREVEGVNDTISRRGICLGSGGSQSVIRDNGSGFFIALHGKWFIRGIKSLPLEGTSVDDRAVFTDLEKFSVWIDEIVDGGEKLHCEFRDGGSTCSLTTSILRENAELTGDHDRENENVGKVEIANGNLKYLPVKFGDFFGNLQAMRIVDSGVVKISRKNFADLPQLTDLKISKCSLKEIPADAFYDLLELDELDLSENQIAAIAEETFMQNPKLASIDLSGNKIRILSDSLFESNLHLERISFESNLVTSIGPGLMSPLLDLRHANFRNNTCVDAAFGAFFTQKRVEQDELQEIIETNCQ